MGVDDIFDGFGERAEEPAVPDERPSNGEILEHAGSDQELRKATFNMYVALSFPLLVISVPVYILGGNVDYGLVYLCAFGVVFAMLWAALRMESWAHVPPHVPGAEREHRRLDAIWRMSMIGSLLTILMSAFSISLAIWRGLAPSMWDHLTILLTAVMLVTVIAGVASFLLPGLQGFRALLQVFLKTESVLSKGNER